MMAAAQILLDRLKHKDYKRWLEVVMFSPPELVGIKSSAPNAELMQLGKEVKQMLDKGFITVHFAPDGQLRAAVQGLLGVGLPSQPNVVVGSVEVHAVGGCRVLARHCKEVQVGAVAAVVGGGDRPHVGPIATQVDAGGSSTTSCVHLDARACCSCGAPTENVVARLRDSRGRQPPADGPCT